MMELEELLDEITNIRVSLRARPDDEGLKADLERCLDELQRDDWWEGE